MSSGPTVLLVDDGELDRFRILLERQGARVDRFHGAPRSEDLERPYDLVVCSGRRAPAVGEALGSGASKAVWITVHPQDFLPLRERLRELGVHYLVHSRVDDSVFRLLCAHALYRGQEKRALPRLLPGTRLRFRDAKGLRPATLIDLTRESCRLLAESWPEGDGRLELILPPELAGGREVTLRGHLLRVDPGAPPDDKRWQIAISFDAAAAQREPLWQALEQGRTPGTRVTRLAETPADLGEPPAGDEDRRSDERAAFARSVLAETGDATHIVVGRDLSTGGMRLAPGSELELGTRMLLSLYGAASEEPVVVRARVERDDGDRGLVLRFEGLSNPMLARLERIVAAGPAVESLAEGSGESGSVVATAEALERGSRG